jgi:hypothetical protein
VRRERCACATSCTICDSTVSGPLVGAHHQAAAAVDASRRSRVAPGAFSTGMGSPVSIDSSTVDGLRAPRRPRALFARPDAQAIADVHVSSAECPPRCRIAAKTARSLSGEPSSALSAADVLGARLELEQLAEQRQRHDDRRGLEIHADAAVLAERIGEQSRRESGDDAVAKAPRRHRYRSASTCSGCDSRIDAPSARRTANRPRAHGADKRVRARSASLRTDLATGARTSRADTPSDSGSVHQKRRRKSASSGILVVVEAAAHGLERHAADRAVARASRTISGCIGHVYVVSAIEVVRGHRYDRSGRGCRCRGEVTRRSVTNFLRQPAEQNL